MKNHYNEDDPSMTTYDPTDPVSHADRVNRSSAVTEISDEHAVAIAWVAADLHAEAVHTTKRLAAEPKIAKHEPLDEYTYLPCGFCHSTDSLATEGIDLVCKVCSTHFGRDYVADMIQRGY